MDAQAYVQSKQMDIVLDKESILVLFAETVKRQLLSNVTMETLIQVTVVELTAQQLQVGTVLQSLGLLHNAHFVRTRIKKFQMNNVTMAILQMETGVLKIVRLKRIPIVMLL